MEPKFKYREPFQHMVWCHNLQTKHPVFGDQSCFIKIRQESCACTVPAHSNFPSSSDTRKFRNLERSQYVGRELATLVWYVSAPLILGPEIFEQLPQCIINFHSRLPQCHVQPTCTREALKGEDWDDRMWSSHFRFTTHQACFVRLYRVFFVWEKAEIAERVLFQCWQ